MRHLTASVRRDDAVVPEGCAAAVTCSFCGLQPGMHGDGASCAACRLVRHLERPRIDEEAILIWLPEMSQAALICLVREMHARLRSAGEGFDGEIGPLIASAGRNALHDARWALSSRAAVASELLETSRPSELAGALVRISRPSYERRHRLLGGIRVLPVGRFFVGAEDVYPAVVDSWRRQAEPASSPTPSRSAA
jgi:hypothetical protein